VISNCHFWVYDRQRQRGGVIVLMPGLFAKAPRARRWWFPVWWVSAVAAQWAWYRYTGQWQHAAYCQVLPGSRGQYLEFEPTERRHLRGFPLFFDGGEGPLSAIYWRRYRRK
jgi:hypothetical protein